MTPADFQLIRETRELLTGISESLVETVARVNDAARNCKKEDFC